MNQKQRNKLLKEAFGCVGMIDETQVKCRLLKAKAKRASVDGQFEEFEATAYRSLYQIRKDYDKYSRRLTQIYQELKSYGKFPHLE